jgi:Leucine Rich repeat
MTPSNTVKANEEPSKLNQRNSLITMLAEGRRLDKRSNGRCAKIYPSLDTHFQPRSIRNRERLNQTSLDTTFHITSHMLDEALSLPIVNSANCRKHENELFLAKGMFTAKLVNSFTHQSYKSIDMSNITNTGNNSDQCNVYLTCFNISTNCSQLQSLCLHNCQIDDTCVKVLASILTSQANKLKSLNLSRNKITDVGAKTLLDAMKSYHCTIEELDLSQNRLTLNRISSFAEDLSYLLHLKVLRLADSEQLVPLSIYQQFSAAIEKNVALQTLTLGSEIMDCIRDDTIQNNFMDKRQRIDATILSFWHEPMYTAVTDHIRALLQQNYSGIGELLCTSRIDVTAIRNVLNSLKPEQELDACFRLLRLRPDILLAVDV